MLLLHCVCVCIAHREFAGRGVCVEMVATYGRLWIGGMCEVQDSICSECECSHVENKKVEKAA